MQRTNFWQNAGLVGIILGAAVLCAMLGTVGHASTNQAVTAALAGVAS